MPVIELTRGPVVEGRHPFSAVLVHGEQVLERWGEPVEAAGRSAAKPFQLWCALEALGDPPLEEPLLALGAASHAGQPEHIAGVRALLARLGVDEGALACGAHPPLYTGAWEQLLRAGEPMSALHNNCSGKHTFMLAACAAAGWEGDYRSPDHPLQRRILERITAWCAERPALGVDGCSVPTFCLSIDGMARAWARLAAPGGDTRLARIAAAMGRHPHLTSGTGRLDEAVMAGAREPMIVKIGAAALFCMAFPARGQAVVVKVHSGDEAALGEAVACSLARLVPGAWAPPPGWAWAEVRSVLGAVVGQRRLAATGY